MERCYLEMDTIFKKRMEKAFPFINDMYKRVKRLPDNAVFERTVLLTVTNPTPLIPPYITDEHKNRLAFSHFTIAFSSFTDATGCYFTMEDEIYMVDGDFNNGWSRHQMATLLYLTLFERLYITYDN